MIICGVFLILLAASETVQNLLLNNAFAMAETHRLFHIARHLPILFAFAVILFISMLFFSWRMHRATIKSLKELADSTISIAHLQNSPRGVNDIDVEIGELAKNIESMRVMLDAMPFACFIWDRSHNIIDANNAAVEFFGFKSRQELVVKFHECSPEFQPNGWNSNALASNHLEDAFNMGNTRFDWMHVLPHTKEEVPTEVTMVRMGYGSEFVVASYVYNVRGSEQLAGEIDLHNRVNILTQKLESTSTELEAALHEAQVASRAKSNFLSFMSHEMRTPINAITGMGTLGKKSNDMNYKDYAFDRMRDASDHLLGVINDVLDMSKIEEGMLTLSSVQFNLTETIENVVELHKFGLDEKKQNIHVKIDGNVPTVLVADDQRLAQVLTNLISNAIKFTPENKNICVGVKVLKIDGSNCTLEFKVADQGIGLSEKQQETLFEPFIQAEASTTRKYGGTGLGLSISKHIVELMDGRISLVSNVGEGAIFTFSIIAKIPESVAVETEEEIDQLSLNFAGKCVLLVEDVEINREIVQTILGESEIDIVTAQNGEEALHIFAANPDRFDVVLMDIHMPIMDGLEATRCIRALDMPWAKEVPIIAMTANVFTEDIEKCLQAGMNAHLGKPLDFSAMFRMLNQLLTAQ